MELDLNQLLRILGRRWWILLLVTSVVAGSIYFASSRQTPLYQATAVFVVNPGVLIGSSDSSSIQDSQRLATTYAQLVNTQPMRDRVANTLGLESISKEDVNVSTVVDTLLIHVRYTHTDPDHAALVANTFVAEFQGLIRDQNDDRIADARTRVDEQIEYLNGLIADIDTELATASDSEVADLQEQRRTFIEMVTQLESDSAQSEMNAASTSAFIESVDPANAPDVPTSPQVMRSTVLGALIGMLIAVGLVALLEYLDNTIKADTNIQELLNAPVLAVIPSEPKVKVGARQVFTLYSPHSGAAEGMRLLRTNIGFASVDADVRSIVITSATQSEGKTTMAANLAVALVQSGKSVVLVDADLRKPTLHRIFGIPTKQGVTTYITNPEQTIEGISQRATLPGLTLIACGPIPPNPAELMASLRFRHLVESLEQEYDVVVIDTAPVLQASDTLVAASVSDGVLMITVHRKTRIETLQRAQELLARSGTNLLGVVVNRADKSETGDYRDGYYGTAIPDEPRLRERNSL